MSLASAADTSHCPDCGAASEAYTIGVPGTVKRHLIVKLERE